MKVEMALNYELRRCEMETVIRITQDLENTAGRCYSKILYWHVKKVRGSG